MVRLVKDVRTLERAKRLRRDMTDPERLMWTLLRDRRFSQWKFRRQVPLGDFVVDFVCVHAKLVIELDGFQHKAPDQAAFDQRRTATLEAVGFRVVRFWNSWLYTEREGVMETIWHALNGNQKSDHE